MNTSTNNWCLALGAIIWRGTLLLILCMFCLFASPLSAKADFSFSETESQEEAADQKSLDESKRLIEELMATPCSGTLKGKKTAVIIAERSSNGGYQSTQSNYGLHFAEINKRLSDLGLRTYSPAEITAQIKAAEIEAYMNNDPDAQISAASRLGASFTLRGLIDSRVTYNTVANVNEVHITMAFTLVTSGGKSVASVTEEMESYAGSDTTGIALTLVREKADIVVAKLYSQYCSNAK